MNNIINMDWSNYFQELKNIDALKLEVERANPDTRWVQTSFPDIICGNFILARYTTDNQYGLLDLIDRCGEVISINRDDENQISSFTVKTYNEQLVEVPFENGSFTGHYTHLHRLE